MKQPAIYIVASKRNGTIYTGVTSNLIKRAYEHRTSAIPGFTSEYHCTHLVYFELHQSMELAISREDQIKSGSRAKKIKLIESINPEWKDLYDDIV